MIYFQITVRPQHEGFDSDSLGRYQVDALFAMDEPRDCLTHLVSILRKDGWATAEITEAQTIFTQSDFNHLPRLSLLYRQAHKEGWAYRLNWTDCRAAG